jgi:class 3 adenylate cyclase
LFDLTITKDLTELIGKNLTFPDIESIGEYIFKKYSTHSLENVNENISISPLNAAKRLVQKCQEENRLEDLFCFIIGLDGSLLNGKRVGIVGMEHLLYRLSNTGIYFDFNKRKLVSFNNDKKLLKNWGSLKDGREYSMTIVSIDICDNSNLVKKYKNSIMEELYYHLWEFIRKKCELFDGRIWSRSGDGSIIAFRNNGEMISGVACCMELLFSLPVFNTSPLKKISDEINIRLGVDSGIVKFYNDTGNIVSDVINYASKLEKTATCTNGLSISEDVYSHVSPAMQKMFQSKKKFGGKTAYTLSFEYTKALL